jgi:hypothetical protein
MLERLYFSWRKLRRIPLFVTKVANVGPREPPGRFYCLVNVNGFGFSRPLSSMHVLGMWFLSGCSRSENGGLSPQSAAIHEMDSLVPESARLRSRLSRLDDIFHL